MTCGDGTQINKQTQTDTNRAALFFPKFQHELCKRTPATWAFPLRAEITGAKINL